METCRRPYSLKGNGVHRGCGRKKSSRQGNVEKISFPHFTPSFPHLSVERIFLKKERRLEVSLHIYSNILNNQKMIQDLQLAILQEILLFKRWGCGMLSCCGGVPFCLPKKEPKMPRGLAPRSASAPVANPGPPIRGTLPGRLYRNAGADSNRIAFCSAPLPLIWRFSKRGPAERRKRAGCQAVGAGSGAGGWGRLPLSGGNGRRPKGVGIIRPYGNISGEKMRRNEVSRKVLC